MASRQLIRNLLSAKQPVSLQLKSHLGVNARLNHPNVLSGNRQFSVLNDLSNKFKGEVERNPEFKKSVKELKEKAEELKGVSEDLKVRTKQTKEQLYKHVDGVWTEAEAAAKKASATMREKISTATEEVKETLGIGKEEATGTTGSTNTNGDQAKHEEKASEEKQQHSASGDASDTFFRKFKSTISSPKVFEKLKDVKAFDLAKKGYDIIREELSDNPTGRKHLEFTPPPPPTGGISSRTDIAVVATKVPRWRKKWESFKEKMQGNPMFKRVSGISEPVVNKSQEIAEDMRERWETSDNPVVHKIQDINETIFMETDAAASFKEIRRRDPSFSLPDLVAEIQDAIRPVLNAYKKGDTEVLSKYCTSEVVERCKAEHTAFESHGIFFDNKILHISEVEVRETKLMGTSPIIVVAFQTQQIHCVRDRNGKITEGGKDTIHTVYYAWAMQQIEPEEVGEGAIYPIWKLRDMQQLGIQALI